MVIIYHFIIEFDNNIDIIEILRFDFFVFANYCYCRHIIYKTLKSEAVAPGEVILARRQ